jgi:4-hydroxythreonine-4-phosphate dehydrogenase
MSKKPVLAVTMGDPAGIGPEIIVKALGDPLIYDRCTPLVVAHVDVMEHAVSKIVKSSARINIVKEPVRAAGKPGTLDLYPLEGLDLGGWVPGRLDARCGNAAFISVQTAIKLAMAKIVDGTVTAPLNKEALHLAGHIYDGHTEIYAKFTGSDNYSMMLVDGKLRVAHVTTHMPLVKVSQALTIERICNVIRLGHEACCRLDIEAPRIAVAGFNPHAGENGLFGSEERKVIAPAVEAAQREGINATGPYPPDTVFCRAAGGGFDLVVAMYHDQGHIPLKLKSFIYDDEKGGWRGMTGVNVTLGLPVIRASVDHGTAFENAGKNVANPQSMTNAIEYAAMLATGGKTP